MKKMDKKAFTLIELIVVIAVVGILVLLGMPRFIGHKDKAELARIQHDVKVMEQEIGTVLINNDDDFNKWEDNNKNLSQLIQEGKLFEKEGDVKEDLPIDKTYKVIPEKYKDKINTKLKGTFYANNDGKVYYEHEKPLLGIPIKPEEKEDLIKEGYIPIATPEDLYSIRSDEKRIYGKDTQWEKKYTGGLDKKYIVVSDLDLSGIANFEPIGKADSEFTGTFDGGGYVISNLTIDKENYVGLFGQAIGATFKNVGLEDVNVTGENYVGSLVGRLSDSSTVTNSYATGTVTGVWNYVGGLAGRLAYSSVSDSYATVKVTGKTYIGGLVGQTDSSPISDSYATGTVNGGGLTGGLVGIQNGSSVTNSYATGTVTGTRDDVGGLVGGLFHSSSVMNSYATGVVTGTVKEVGGLVGSLYYSSSVTNSYATGLVTGTVRDVGGLVGLLYDSSVTVTNSYYNKETTEQSDTGKGTGKTTDEMKKSATYSDWDFKETWKIDEDKDYPKLR